MDDLERLRGLLAKARGMPWAYRPQEYDDWGTIRCAPDADGWAWIAARVGNLGLGEEQYAEHRRAKTDPFETETILIVEAVNALPGLLYRITALQAEAARWKAMAEELSDKGRSMRDAVRKARDRVPDEEDGLAAELFAYHLNIADHHLGQSLSRFNEMKNG